MYDVVLQPAIIVMHLLFIILLASNQCMSDASFFFLLFYVHTYVEVSLQMLDISRRFIRSILHTNHHWTHHLVSHRVAI
jgi:hypothetical protein